MSLPPEIEAALAEVLARRRAREGKDEAAEAKAGSAGSGASGAGPVRGVRPLGGGCIHSALKVETDGAPIFLKWNRGEEGVGFVAEARGLEALRAATADEGLLAIPEVLDARDAEGNAPGWLALEFLPPSPPAPDHDERLGRGLARLHGRVAPRRGQAGVGEVAAGTGQAEPAFGWPETNRIGPLPQPNPLASDWPTFWTDARLTPQIRATRDEGGLDPADVDLLERVVAATPVALAPVADDPPALVHGDLWSGNAHPGPDGRPVLVDPAAYHGHGEVDLAMMRLFGGFGDGTFAAYREVRPVPDGFDAVRCPLYQLYYLLVHVRLFGRGYLARTRAAARAVRAAVG